MPPRAQVAKLPSPHPALLTTAAAITRQAPSVRMVESSCR